MLPEFFLWVCEALYCCVQAARDIAGTIANSSNRVLLNADSLLLNLVGLNERCMSHLHSWLFLGGVLHIY